MQLALFSRFHSKPGQRVAQATTSQPETRQTPAPAPASQSEAAQPPASLSPPDTTPPTSAVHNTAAAPELISRPDTTPPPARATQHPPGQPAKPAKSGWLGSRLRQLFGSGTRLDAATREQLEELLLLSDVGLETTDLLLNRLSSAAASQPHANPQQLLIKLVEELLEPSHIELLPPGKGAPLTVLLMVGTNGSGKTTTIAKLAHYYSQRGYQPLLAAGDTFRAAAIEQLQNWSNRLGLTTIAHKQGADSAAVVFDAISAAGARGHNLVLADTAGRLHNKQQLLAELKKIYHSAGRANPAAKLLSLLVLDATTGTSAIPLIRQFHQTTPLAGVIITKLDGSAKGGAVLAICHELGLPVPFLGLGEGIQDLRTFNPTDFARQLIG